MSVAAVVRWLAVVAASVALSYLLGRLGIPGPTLFAGLLAGLLAALSGRVELDVPHRIGQASFAVLGVVIGQAVTLSVIQAVAADALAVAFCLVTTLALSVGVGFALSTATAIDRPTGAFGMIAGGASGVVVVSEEAGADAALVAVMQYLRVLVVVFSIPLVTALAGAGGGGGAGPPAAGALTPRSVLFCAVVAAAGAGAAALVRLQSSALLGPMLLAAAIAIAWPSAVQPTPGLFQDVAFLVVGLQIGLRFSVARLRLAARYLPAILAAILAVMAGCAAIGLGMAWATGRPFYECYLATTPGGLNAVLAAAIQGGADVAYVTSVQVLRLFVMLLAAPVLGWWIKRRP